MKPWNHKEGIAIGAGLILTGALLQLTLGRVEWDVFAAPVNYIALVLFIVLLVIAHLLRRKIYVIEWLSSSSAAITSIAWSSLMTVVMGLVRQVPSSAGHTAFPSLDQMLSNWSFVLVYVWMMISLGLAVLRVCIPLKVKKIPFLLTHLGLFIAVVCGVLGSADLQRLKMYTTLNTPEWRAMDDKGAVHELPLAVELKSFNIKEYPPKLMLVDNNTGNTLPDGAPQNILLEEGVDGGELLGWKVEVKTLLLESAPVFTGDDVRYNEYRSTGCCASALICASKEGAESVEGWVSCGSYAFPVKALTLNDEVSIVMPEREPQSYISAVNIYTKSGKSLTDTIKVNSPCRVEGWKLYQLDYDHNLGRWSETSVLEAVRDPWMGAVYVGIWMLIAGAVSGLLINSRWRYKWIPGFSLVACCAFTLINLLKTEIHSKTLMPALQSPWFTPHITVYMFAYALLGAAALMAIYLMCIKRKPATAGELSLCDNLTGMGLVFMTIGMLFGAFWAEQAWGHYWAWDPKETWAAATWLAYLCYIHLRHSTTPGDSRKSRAALLILLISFVFLQMCWWGINFLPSAQGVSVHTYNQ